MCYFCCVMVGIHITPQKAKMWLKISLMFWGAETPLKRKQKCLRTIDLSLQEHLNPTLTPFRQGDRCSRGGRPLPLKLNSLSICCVIVASKHVQIESVLCKFISVKSLINVLICIFTCIGNICIFTFIWVCLHLHMQYFLIHLFTLTHTHTYLCLHSVVQSSAYSWIQVKTNIFSPTWACSHKNAHIDGYWDLPREFWRQIIILFEFSPFLLLHTLVSWCINVVGKKYVPLILK